MTNKVAFFYLNGTDALINQVAFVIGQLFNQPRLGLVTVPGLNGITTTWQDGAPRNDPFVNLLDPNIFEAKKIGYPALGFPFKLSMDIGVFNLQAAITSLPKGQKFMIGGYSQGAACASEIMLRLRPGGSLYSSRGGDFLGGVCFGSPRRQVNYRGEVGGTWSGAWDVPGSTTGGHGSFPTTGPYARLTDCDPTKWIEFTDIDDIITSTGDSQNGLGWVEGNQALINNDLVFLLQNIFDNGQPSAAKTGTNAAFATAEAAFSYLDALGRSFTFPGAGHAAYPWRPPPGNPENGLTSFQIGVRWLTSKANAYSVGADVLPPTPSSVSTAGWTTSLIPPAA